MTTVAPLPGYRDLAPLGRGGYSEVYRAYQEQFDRWVALKVLTFTLADERSQRRFLRECRLAGRLSNHPNIVTIYNASIGPDGRPSISMELCPEGSISDVLSRRGPFPVAEALRIGIALAGALETAHRAGVVHRDVKPANVLMASYGQPILTDFGLSIVAERQEVSVGSDALTPYHAAPEVLERVALTPAADVYSLASTVYTMLAGRAPHQVEGQDSTAGLLLRILQQDVAPLARSDLPPSLARTVNAALARDPGQRTSTALAFALALQDAQRELGEPVTEPVVMEAPPATDPVFPVAPPSPSPGSGPPPDPFGPVGPGVPPGVPVPGVLVDGGMVPSALAPPGGRPPSAEATIHRSRLGRPGAPEVAALRPSPEPSREAADFSPDFGEGSPLGSVTVHRDDLRRSARTGPAHAEPRRRSRRGLVLVLCGLLVAGVAAGAVALTMGRDDGDGRDAPSSDDPTTTTVDVEVPANLTALESEAGVQLDWDGSDRDRYAVLVLSEEEAPRVIPADAGPSLLVPAPALLPEVGYCFAVAYLDAVSETPADQTAAAFSPPVCIRGAAENTVRPE